MRRLVTLAVLIFGISFNAFSQSDGGMVWGQPDTAPAIILWFKVIDQQSHVPITNAVLNLKEDGSGAASGEWTVNRRGVATYIASDIRGIPGSATVEIVAPGYKYATIHIEQWDLLSHQNDNRLFLPAFPVQWADLNEIPNTQQLVDLLGAEQFTTGVRVVRGQAGVQFPNLAPPCYKWMVEMQRTR